jgi:hypothetical protein
LPSAAGNADDVWDGGKGAMTVTNGLYTIQIEMTDGGHGRANGVIVLHDGKIAGGDSYFYYTGSYRADHGKWLDDCVVAGRVDASIAINRSRLKATNRLGGGQDLIGIRLRRCRRVVLPLACMRSRNVAQA